MKIRTLSLQELKGRILVKGKRLNKLDAAFNNNTEDADSVSEEDEAAEAKNGDQEAKPKVRRPNTVTERRFRMNLEERI